MKLVADQRSKKCNLYTATTVSTSLAAVTVWTIHKYKSTKPSPIQVDSKNHKGDQHKKMVLENRIFQL